MKRHLAIGLLLLLALAACQGRYDDPVETQNLASQQPVVSEELQAVDSLMWQRPDSALAILLPWFDTVDSNETFDNHYAHLLLAELLYKNDYAQTNREALLGAVAFFDSLVRQAPPLKGGRGDSRHALDQKGNLAFLSARAHYINGVGYYEQDSVVEACREYLKALKVMEERFEEKELVGEKARFMAFTYTHLTGLFSDQYLHEQAIYFGKEALNYYRKYEATPWHVAWMLNQMGSHYEMMEQFDSSAFYYGKAIRTLNDTSCILFRDIVSHQAMLEYKSSSLFEKSLVQLKRTLSFSQSDDEYLVRCATIGEIYFCERQFDSALVYLNQVFRESQNEELKKQDAELLVGILKMQGRDSEIFEYAEFLVPFANVNENQGFLKSQLMERYHVYEEEKQEALHYSKQKETLRNEGLIILGLVTAFLVGFAIYIIINKRRIIAERNVHRMQQAALSGRLKESNETLRNVAQQRAMNLYKTEGDKALERILAEFEAVYPQGMEELQTSHPDLTETERQIIVLSFLGFRVKEEAELTGLTPNTVAKYRTNIRKKAGSDPISRLIR